MQKDYYMFDTAHAMARCYGKMKIEVRGKMASKKKIKRFQAVQAVKELARERMGAPPTGKVVPHKNKKAEKHKPTLEKLLDETE
jgi:hypothetical protein